MWEIRYFICRTCKVSYYLAPYKEIEFVTLAIQVLSWPLMVHAVRRAQHRNSKEVFFIHYRFSLLMYLPKSPPTFPHLFIIKMVRFAFVWVNGTNSFR